MNSIKDTHFHKKLQLPEESTKCNKEGESSDKEQKQKKDDKSKLNKEDLELNARFLTFQTWKPKLTKLKRKAQEKEKEKT